MAVSGYDATDGSPLFLDTDAPDIKVDPRAAAIYAADVGNRIVRANLAALDAYGYKRAGLAGFAEDTETDYVHDGTGWRATWEDTGWITAPLVNSWVTAAAGEEVEYCRLNGMVLLKGRAALGSATTVFTLPVGFRPKSISRFIVATSATAASPPLVYVSPNGVVTSSTGVQPNFAPVSFRADG